MNAPGYGQAFKKAVLDPLTSVVPGRLRRVPAPLRQLHRDRSVVVDKFGIPVLRMTMSWGENERKMIPDMAVDRDRNDGGRGREEHPAVPVPTACPASASTRWARRAWAPIRKTSVLNPFLPDARHQQPLVMDASCFVSGGCQNPTLTIMALTVRGCDHLMEEMKEGNV